MQATDDSIIDDLQTYATRDREGDVKNAMNLYASRMRAQCYRLMAVLAPTPASFLCWRMRLQAELARQQRLERAKSAA